MSYQLTHDWFQAGPHLWPRIKPQMKQRESFLEIGSYEGRSAVWTVEHMLEDNGSITCVDTWEGGEEHAKENMKAVEARFDHNINLARDTFPNREIYKVKATSVDALTGFITGNYKFDFIYIDGSHRGRDVITDSCLAWQVLKPGGILVWDDYLWGDTRDVLHKPKIAIDTFMLLFGEEITPVFVGYQVIIQRNNHA